MLTPLLDYRAAGHGSGIHLPDNILLNFGDDNDIAMVLRSAVLPANTALTNVLIGTPVAQALAANSLIISNITDSGDIAMYGNLAGHSQQFFFYDTSDSRLHLSYAAGTYATAANFGRVNIGSTGAITVDTNTVPVLASLILNEPNIKIGTGTVTLASTLYIAGAPTEGTTNYACYVASGGSYFGGNLTFADAQAISTLAATGNYLMFKTQDTGVGLVEVARIIGADDPYFAMGGSQQFKFYNSGGADLVGKVGIGVANSANFQLFLTMTNLIGTSNLDFYGERINVDQSKLSGDGNYSGTAGGLLAVTYMSASNTSNWTAAYGLRGIRGVTVTRDSSGGTITGAVSLIASADFSATGSAITNRYGAYIENAVVNGGTKLVNQYGLYIDVITGGTSVNYAIYAAGGLNYLAGATTFGNIATWNTSVDSVAVIDMVSIGAYEIGAGHRALAISSEEVVVAGIAVASTHKYPVRINGATYNMLLSNV